MAMARSRLPALPSEYRRQRSRQTSPAWTALRGFRGQSQRRPSLLQFSKTNFIIHVGSKTAVGRRCCTVFWRPTDHSQHWHLDPANPIIAVLEATNLEPDYRVIG